MTETEPAGPSGFRDMALGALAFSLMTLFVKVAGQRIPNQEIVFVRGVITLVISYLLLKRANLRPWGNRRRGLILRGLCGFGALTFMYYAMVELPLADATVLQYLNPLWAAVLGAFYLGERLGRREWVFALGSLLGVIVIARPEFLFGGLSSTVNPVAVAAGLTGAAFSGAAYVLIRELSKSEHQLVIVFYFPLVTVPAATPGMLANWTTPTLLDCGMLAGVGIAAQVGQLYITRGLQKEEVGRGTAMGYLQVVFAAIWGVVFFGEIPDVWTISGALVILACTIGIVLTRRPPTVTTPRDPIA